MPDQKPLTQERVADWLQKLHNPSWVNTHPIAAKEIERRIKDWKPPVIEMQSFKGQRLCDFCNPHIEHRGKRCGAPLPFSRGSNVKTCNCLGNGRKTPVGGIVTYQTTWNDTQERTEELKQRQYL